MTAEILKQFFTEKAFPIDSIQEIRIRVNRPVILHIDGREIITEIHADRKLIREMLEIFSKHSLYAYEDEIRQGFLTIEGGHRIGIAGKIVLDEKGERIRTIKEISALNIRIAHERQGCADRIIPFLYEDGAVQNTMLLSPPGAGKTTMLRDVIRQISDGTIYGKGRTVSVIDERSELGASVLGVPQCNMGMRTDIMDGCPKVSGMLMMIRSMAPEVVAVDEIGSREDLEALQYVMKCGCGILATVHGNSMEDLKCKPVLKEILKEGIFSRFVILSGNPKPGTIKEIYKQKKGSGEEAELCDISEF